MTSLNKVVQSTELYKSYKVNKSAKEIQKWNSEDNNNFTFYSKFINPKDTCFDIGANMGNRTKIFHKIVGPEGHVISAEPQNYCMRVLKKAFGNEPNIHFVNKALGGKKGESQIIISNETTVSSMSKKWIKSVTASKRFGSETQWSKHQKVIITTLDDLIETFGSPSFIKIDVEGYEKEVLLGFSEPISTCFSLEFTPEFLDSTFDCLDYLAKIGPIKCNYSMGESLNLELSSWVSKNKMKNYLRQYKDDVRFFGDVYIKLNKNSPI